jgi:hypothetical protein
MSSFIKIVLVFAAGFLLCQYTHEAEAQTVQVTDNRGYSMGTVQINGNTAQFVNPMGYTTQTATIYPNQVVITDFSNRSITVGQPSYTVPPSPPTPMTPRVLQ